jgi:hypothetical protein
MRMYPSAIGGLVMNEVLSYDEIQRKYNGEWVLIAYTEVDRNLKPIAGEVIAHSVDRDEVYGAVSRGKGRDIAIECFVKTPEDMVFIL